MTTNYDRKTILARIDRRIEAGTMPFLLRPPADQALQNIAAGQPDATIKACGMTWTAQQFIDFVLR
jgi:hypothetical protein